MRGLNSIVYASSATLCLSEDDLQNLLEGSRALNSVEEITGVLFFSAGNFIQYIEGPDVALSRVYSRICLDKRHRKITQLFSQPVAERFFSGWPMGYAPAQVQDFDEMLSAPWPPLTRVASASSDLSGIRLRHGVWLRLKNGGI